MRGAACAGLLVAAAMALAGCPPGDPSAEDVVGDGPSSVHEELAMPAEPTHSVDDFPLAAECVQCHPNHVAEWQTSSHAYSMTDPVFRALVVQRQVDLGGKEDQFCTQCHSAIGTRGGECVQGFNFNSLSPIVLEGVTCAACHTVTEVVRTHNSGHKLDPAAALGGPIADPASNGYHASRHDPSFQTSEFCGGCHDVIETSGLELERPYAEWLQSPSNAAGQTCQDCHMPSYTGEAAVGGPQREVHRHTFIGVGMPLVDGFLTEAELAAKDADIVALLDTAASLFVTAPDAVAAGRQFDLVVTMRNDIPGHNLPTGTTFIRQVWLAVTVTDAEGRVVYRTGHLDDNGDLRDVWSEVDPFGDPDLITLSSRLIDALGEPTLFPWRAAEHLSSSLPPLHDRTVTLFVPTPQDAAGPLTIDAQIKFRTFPPYLMRALGLDALVDKLVVRDIATATATVTVTP